MNIYMILASLILSVAFICSMCILVIVSKGDEKSSSTVVEYKQPDIHIYNNNNSHGGNSISSNNTTTDNVSEDMVKEELAQLRNELARKQQLDMEIMEQLNKLDNLINK